MTTPLDELPLIKAGGLLFIGDPHLGSIKPGRRKDVDFGATVLGAVAQAIAVANARRLVPVFLGDIFDRPHEEDERLKTGIGNIGLMSDPSGRTPHGKIGLIGPSRA